MWLFPFWSFRTKCSSTVGRSMSAGRISKRVSSHSFPMLRRWRRPRLPVRTQRVPLDNVSSVAVNDQWSFHLHVKRWRPMKWTESCFLCSLPWRFCWRHPVFYSEADPRPACQVPKQACLRTNCEVSLTSPFHTLSLQLDRNNSESSWWHAAITRSTYKELGV